MGLVQHVEDGVIRGDLVRTPRGGGSSTARMRGQQIALEELEETMSDAQALGFIRAKLDVLPRWSAEAERLDDERIRLERRLLLRTASAGSDDG